MTDVPGRRVWLAVVSVDKVPEPLGKTLTEVVIEIGAAIEHIDPSATTEWELRLVEAGYDHDHEYSGTRWLISETVFHSVSEGFPRIVAPVEPGVSNVSYSLALSACAPFRVETSVTKFTIFGRGNNE